MVPKDNMAKKRFKDMTAKERRESRRKSRLRKKEAKQQPRFSRPPSRRDIERFIRPTAKADPVIDVPATIKELAGKKQPEGFVEEFIDLVSFLPAGDRERAFGFLGTFSKQDPEQQKEFLQSLEAIAREAVGPTFDLFRGRLKEDLEFQKQAIKRQENFATSNFNRIKKNLDFNAIRDKAKVNRALGSTIRRIGSRSFVTGVKGTSGLLRRRTEEQRTGARIQREDIDIARSQQLGAAGQVLNQQLADIQSREERLDVLFKRGEEDLLQKEEVEQRSLVLDLLENQRKGLTAQNLLTVGPTEGSVLESITGGGTRADVAEDRARKESLFEALGIDERFINLSEEEKFAKKGLTEDQLKILELAEAKGTGQGGRGFVGGNLSLGLTEEEIATLPKSVIQQIVPSARPETGLKNVIFNFGRQEFGEKFDVFRDIREGRDKAKLEEGLKMFRAGQTAESVPNVFSAPSFATRQLPPTFVEPEPTPEPLPPTITPAPARAQTPQRITAKSVGGTLGQRVALRRKQRQSR
jgi:hypothetical protein